MKFLSKKIINRLKSEMKRIISSLIERSQNTSPFHYYYWTSPKFFDVFLLYFILSLSSKPFVLIMCLRTLIYKLSDLGLVGTTLVPNIVVNSSELIYLHRLERNDASFKVVWKPSLAGVKLVTNDLLLRVKKNPKPIPHSHLSDKFDLLVRFSGQMHTKFTGNK